jgi:hypothetical protein
MRDNAPIPNFGSFSDPALNVFARTLEQAFRQMAARGAINLTRLNFEPMLVATLPARSLPGDVAYAGDGRKNGEGAGAGTGVLVFFDGNNWIACDSGQTVAD